MGQEHAQGDGTIRCMRIADGIAQIRRKVFIERKLTGFDEGKRAERHDRLADGSDAEAGFRLDRHGWMKTGVAEAEGFVLSGRTAQNDARADGSVFAEDIFNIAFKEDAASQRKPSIPAI